MTQKITNEPETLAGTTQEDYLMIAGSSCRELIVTLFAGLVSELEEATQVRAQLSRDLNGKFSMQAEAEHRKRLVHGEIDPDKWQPVDQLREFYRQARTNGRRQVTNLILKNEKPIISKAFDKLAAYLIEIRKEVEALEEGFFREFGVERPAVLPKPIDSKLRSIESARTELDRGSYYDITKVLREFFGADIAAGILPDAEESGAGSGDES